MTLNLIQIFIPILMALFGVLHTFIYFGLKKRFYSFPLVAAEITESRILNQLGSDGSNMLEAIIFFKYSFRGKEFESNTPALRGYELFPSYDFENSLVKKYRPGDIVNARVHSDVEGVAFLEIAPFSKASAVMIPIMIFGAVAFCFAYYYGFWSWLYEYISVEYYYYRHQL